MSNKLNYTYWYMAEIPMLAPLSFAHAACVITVAALASLLHCQLVITYLNWLLAQACPRMMQHLPCTKIGCGLKCIQYTSSVYC